MLLYNSGARAQEIADLRVDNVDLRGPLRVRLHGKGDKWRSCPLWPETAEALKQLNSEHCTCGCGLTLAQCRLDDPDCGVSLPLAQKLVERIEAGK